MTWRWLCKRGLENFPTRPWALRMTFDAEKTFFKVAKQVPFSPRLRPELNVAKAGRKPKPYVTSWGEVVAGLARQGNDGRWRVVETGQRFTEPDERRAVRRFREQHETKVELVQIPVLGSGQAKTGKEANRILAPRAQTVYGDDNDSIIVREAHPQAIWSWIRRMLIEKPEYVSKMTDIPELINLGDMNPPGPALRISTVIEAYRRNSPALEMSKRNALTPLKRLVKEAKAKTLDDLTIEKLIAFRDRLEAEGEVLSAATRQEYFARIKTVIAFGKRVGLDTSQINACLDRCRVLWAAQPSPILKPEPISRADFHTLLSKGGEAWRPWLLLGLNLCLHLGEVCDLKWEDFDLEKGTYAAIRNKTRRRHIPRAAVLWPETIEALKMIGPLKPFVLVSRRGTRYDRAGRSHEFCEVRRKAGLPETVTFEGLRDGSYTAAAQAPGIDEKFVRVLAGQRSPGLQDNYVLRNPECVRSACDAVYAAYGPFPPGPPEPSTTNRALRMHRINLGAGPQDA